MYLQIVTWLAVAMAMEGEAGMLQELVKAVLLDCMKHSHTPSPNRVQHLAYLLSPLHDPGKERKVGAASQRVLLSVLMETLKESFSQCSAQLEQHQYAKSTPDYLPDSPHSPWKHLAGLLGDSPHPLFLPPLFTLSRHSSVIIHVLNSLADSLSFDQTHLLTSLAEGVWGVELTSLVRGPLKEVMGVSEWHTCLARAAVGLVVTDVMGAVISGCGNERRDVSAGDCVSKWRMVEGVSPLLDALEQVFPASLYRHYCQRETEEKVGTVGGEEAGHALKVSKILSLCSQQLSDAQSQSVCFLVDSVSLMEVVARGCGHMQLLRTSSEYALRLVTQSTTHLHQVSDCTGPHFQHH